MLPQPWALILLTWIVLGCMVGLYPSGREVALAQQDLQAGRPGDAARHLAQAAKGRPWHAGWWEAAGRLALQGDNPQSAVEWLETAHRREGLSIEGMADLGEAYQRIGKLEAALQAWDAAEERGIPVEKLAQRRLEVHRVKGDWAGTASDLQILAAQQPKNAMLRYELGLTLAATQPQISLAYLVQAGELDTRLKSSTDLLADAIRSAQLEGDRAFLLINAGRALASLSECSLAVEAFHQATLARPDYAEAWAFLGEARQHLGEGELSRINPSGCGENQQVRGRALTENRQETADLAIADLERAITLDPGSLSAQLLLSLYWQRRNCPAQALDALQAAYQLAPENPVLLVELGTTRAAAGDLNGAQADYEAAIRLVPSDPFLWRSLAAFTLKYDFHVQEIGLPAAYQAVLLAPQDPANLDAMAQVLLQLNDLPDARRFLERALGIQPDYAPAWLHLGWIHLLEGERREAFHLFQQAIAMDPGSPTADQAQRSLKNYFP